MTFFSGRDTNLDVARTYLMLGMIVAHVIFWFYRPYFNSHLTYHLTIGFVFISAFTMTVVSTRRLAANRAAAGRSLAVRGLKLILIFLVANLAIVAMAPRRLEFLKGMNPMELVVSILLGTAWRAFSFEILVPIGVFFMTMWAMTPASKYRLLPPLLLILFGGLIALFEWRGWLDTFGTKFYLVAGIGCMTGLMAEATDWARVAAALSRRPAVLIAGASFVAAYFLGIASRARGPIYHVSYHIVPLIVLLFAIYLFSHRYELGRTKVMDLLNRLLAGHMLFVYLFHLMLLNLLAGFITPKSLELLPTLGMLLAVLAITMGATQMVEVARRRWAYCDRLYALVFK